MKHEEYEELPGMNWSRLKLMDVSPLHFHRTPPREESIFLRKGLAVHTLVLEPDEFDEEYMVWPGQRRGKMWLEFKEDYEDDYCILTEAEADEARAIANAVLAHDDAMSLLSRGKSEQPLLWTDAETGIKCKGRTDYYRDRLVDLKTSAFVEVERYSKQCARLLYHCQLAFYKDGLVANGASPDMVPAMVVVESSAPYDVVVYDIPDHVINLGRDLYRRLLGRYAECMKSGVWPGVANGQRLELILPEWLYTNNEDADPLTVGGKVMHF